MVNERYVEGKASATSCFSSYLKVGVLICAKELDWFDVIFRFH